LAATHLIDGIASNSGNSPIPIELPEGVPPEMLKLGARAALMSYGEQLFVSGVTASQILFDGYEDKIFGLAKSMNLDFPERMGLFFGKNNTDDGVYVIDSGAKNISNLGRILSWKGHSDLGFMNWWNSSETNRILGSDGTLYPPFIQRSDKLDTYISDICRSMYLTYAADVEFEGIKAYRFRLDENAFNASNPENDGYCWPMKERIYDSPIQPNKSGGWCLPSGMNDISKCQFGAPIVSSMPQFVFAPEEVKQSVTGLSDSTDDYLPYLDVEPTSGVLLRGARMVQLNVLMLPDPQDIFSKNMKPVIVPLAWVNETVVVDTATRDYIYQNAVAIRESAFIAAYAFIGVGLLLIVCAAVRLAVARHNAKAKRGRYVNMGN